MHGLEDDRCIVVASDLNNALPSYFPLLRREIGRHHWDSTDSIAYNLLEFCAVPPGVKAAYNDVHPAASNRVKLGSRAVSLGLKKSKNSHSDLVAAAS